MYDLDVSVLPDLPQKHVLTCVLTDLWQDPAVVALWLGGSLARSAADIYSDVDLRVAVWPVAFEPDHPPDSAKLLKENAVVHLPAKFGEHATLHHMLLANGELYDLLVQTTEHTPAEEVRLVLACRDEAFCSKLAGGKDPTTSFQPANGEVIRQLIIAFWMAQQRHQKVLYRDLLLIAWVGERLMRQILLRLWYVLATGADCGPLDEMTIHTLSPVVRAVQQLIGDDVVTLIGQPLTTKEEIVEGTAHVRDEVARAGRQLAEKLRFDYPSAVEETVRQGWRRFAGMPEDSA